jgi:hypothetical protein
VPTKTCVAQPPSSLKVPLYLSPTSFCSTQDNHC